MNCPSCGARDQTEKFCTSCGTLITRAEDNSLATSTPLATEAARDAKEETQSPPETETTARPGTDEKACPACAETVKGAAVICRYCGHDFRQPLPPPSEPAALRHSRDREPDASQTTDQSSPSGVEKQRGIVRRRPKLMIGAIAVILALVAAIVALTRGTPSRDETMLAYKEERLSSALEECGATSGTIIAANVEPDGQEWMWIIEVGDDYIDSRRPACTSRGDSVCLPDNLSPAGPSGFPWVCRTGDLPSGVWVGTGAPIGPTPDDGWVVKNEPVSF